MTKMEGDDKTLFDLDVAIGTAFYDSREWQKLQKEKNSIARDIYLAIGATHLRGPDFYDDCFKLQRIIRPGDCECCGQPTGAKIDGAMDLLRILWKAKDDALRNPWKPMSNYWNNASPSYHAQMIVRELRLRELLECIRGRKHIRWHVNRKATDIKHKFEFTI